MYNNQRIGTPFACHRQHRQLYTAAMVGDVWSVRNILSQGFHRTNSLYFSNGDTPLHVACYNRHFMVVRELLKHKAPIDRQSMDGSTPLMAACSCGSLTIVKWLLKNGADVHLQNINGEDALNVACHWKQWDVVEELLRNGADPTTVTFLKDGLTSAQMIQSINEKDDLLLKMNGEDVLNVACRWKEWDVVEELLQNGAEPTTVTFLKGPPLSIKALNAADLL